MTYAPPSATAASFALNRAPYAPPGDSSVTFALPGGGPIEPPGPGDFDHPAPPSHQYQAGARWSRPGYRHDQATAPTWAHADRRDGAAALPWGKGARTDRDARLAWQRAEQRDISLLRLTWNTPPPEDQPSGLAWGTPGRRDQALGTPWDASTTYRDQFSRLTFIDPPPQDLDARGAWRRGGIPDTQVTNTLAAYAPPRGIYRRQVHFSLQRQDRLGAYRRPSAQNAPFALGERTWTTHARNTQARDATDTRLPWGIGTSIALETELPWGWGFKPWRDIEYSTSYPQDPGDPDPNGPAIEPIVRLTYHTMNIINVGLLNGTPINCRDITITLDVDSWAWAFSGTIIGHTNLALVAPGPSGPIDIQVSINGHQWIFMIESYRGAEKFADSRFTISGVSRTQYMAPPYAPARSKLATNAINAVQAATEELQYTGYTLDWDFQPGDTTPDWTFPPGVFSYQALTPVQVIKKIADTAGAILVPHRYTDGWTLKPRFPASPWDIDSAYADAIVHYSVVIDKALTWQPAPLYDTVFISGTSAGKGVEVTRYGSGGQLPGPDLFEDWLVHTDVNRERGRQVLAASGNHALIDITTSIPDAQIAPGLIEPGDILEYREADASTWRGYVLGTTISAPGSGAARILQTVKVIRFYEH